MPIKRLEIKPNLGRGLIQYMEYMLTKLKHGEQKKIYYHKTDHCLYGFKFAGHTVILNIITKKSFMFDHLDSMYHKSTNADLFQTLRARFKLFKHLGNTVSCKQSWNA